MSHPHASQLSGRGLNSTAITLGDKVPRTPSSCPDSPPPTVPSCTAPHPQISPGILKDRIRQRTVFILPGLDSARKPEARGIPLSSCTHPAAGQNTSLDVYPYNRCCRNPEASELFSPPGTRCPSYQPCIVQGRIHFIISAS